MLEPTPRPHVRERVLCVLCVWCFVCVGQVLEANMGAGPKDAGGTVADHRSLQRFFTSERFQSTVAALRMHQWRRGILAQQVCTER